MMSFSLLVCENKIGSQDDFVISKSQIWFD